MFKLRALIAAAGRGTRSGLPYPKTLYQIQGAPILIRIARLLQPYDERPTVVISPEGKDLVARCLDDHAMAAELVIQVEPRGMGDAVLCFKESPAYNEADHILLIWGDIPFIQPETVEELVTSHFKQLNDFTLVTKRVNNAYTIVSRDLSGLVSGVRETRELGLLPQPSEGERDIGLFIFRKQPVFTALKEDLSGKFGQVTGEHGFLYVIQHLFRRGYRVAAVPVATELDLVSLNSLADIREYL
jgi:bifunctional N-acetylglucosamine-1-phosphate-uridyltransferase/glucosamine-1-phosphate-acetyltransferase GlmU-like protein